MPQFRLVTLGSVHVEGSQWRPPKVLTLLSYLSIQGPTSRRRLRELFWPDAQDPGASLRVLLGQVRRQLPGAVVGEETVEARLSSDASALLGLSAAEPAGVELYGGPFLAGVELSDVSPELQEWVLDTRDRLAGAARLAALRAAEQAGSPSEAGEWAQRAAAILDGPSMEPEMVERLLRFALPGSLLEAELRREQLEYGESPTAPLLDLTSEPELLGREWELDSLLLALSDSEVRLLEITGAGGIGKSTLATALLREQADLTGVQVLSIPLETAQAVSEAAARMVVALKLQVNDRGDGWLALARAWGERPLLVLLDGAEGLPDLGRGIDTLLTHCKGVRVVVTSRVQRLTVQRSAFRPSGETVHLALDGLSVPAPGEPPARVARSAAVQLFVRGARRFLPRFAADAQNAPLVSAIVRRLDGHPLATVLCATWMRVYSLSQVHTFILKDLTALRAEDSSRERHQLSAVFERSWHLLTPEEAQAVAVLAVFQGFTPAAAQSVSDVLPALLHTLKTHSLLRDLPGGRLEVPPVLAAQAQAHLTNATALQDAYAAYYLNHLMTHAPESDEVNTERANIVAATGYCVSQGRNMSAQIDMLLASYDRRGLLDSGIDAFNALREELPNEESETAGSILVGLAWLASQSGRRMDAEQIAAVMLNRADAFSKTVQMKATNIMAISLMYRKKTDEAIVFYEQAIGLARSLGDTARQVMYSLNISAARCHTGRYEEAMQSIQAILVDQLSELPREMKMLIEGQIIEIRYSSSALLPDAMEDLFIIYLDSYKDRETTKNYMVTRCLYLAFLIDNVRLEPARRVAKQLTTILESAQMPHILLAKRIAEVRLLYLQGRSGEARTLALNSLEEATKMGDEDGICEIILATVPDILGDDAALGLQLLELVIGELSHSELQERRAIRLLAGRQSDENMAGLGRQGTLERLKSALNRVGRTA